MNDDRPLILRRDGAVAHLRFNRPKALNSIDSATAQALLAASEELAQRHVGARGGAVRRGQGLHGRRRPCRDAGRSAGASRAGSSIRCTRRLRSWRRSTRRSIASVHGVVAGAGVEPDARRRLVRRRRGYALQPRVRRTSARAATAARRSRCRASWACARRWRSRC